MFCNDIKGIKISSTDFWLDAHRKTPFSFVSHGHSDHLKNHDKILATPPTISFHAFRARQRQVLTLDFGEKLLLEDMEIELFPAGHILGSAMIRIKQGDTSLLYTGDFKMKKSWTSKEIIIPSADILIMESTFGHPDYIYDHSPEFLVNELLNFINDCFHKNITPVVLAYSLGKAQEAMKILGECGLLVHVHRSAWELTKIYRKFGVSFENCVLWDEIPIEKDHVLLAPPHSFRYGKIKNLPSRYRTVFLSGWAKSENGYRFASDYAIPLSDHADFNELLQFVKIARPQKVYTTHGFEDFPKYLQEMGYDAELLKEKE